MVTDRLLRLDEIPRIVEQIRGALATRLVVGKVFAFGESRFTWDTDVDYAAYTQKHLTLRGALAAVERQRAARPGAVWSIVEIPAVSFPAGSHSIVVTVRPRGIGWKRPVGPPPVSFARLIDSLPSYAPYIALYGSITPLDNAWRSWESSSDGSPHPLRWRELPAYEDDPRIAMNRIRAAEVGAFFQPWLEGAQTVA